MTIYDYEHLQTLVLVDKPTLVREDTVGAVYQGRKTSARGEHSQKMHLGSKEG